MKPIKLILIAATLAPLSLAPAIADAQPGYYAQPQPSTQLEGGFHNRQGRLIFGFSLGLGTMSDSEGEIGGNASVNYSTLSGMASGHIGGFIGPRLALMAELQGNIVTLSSDGYDNVNLVQSALMGAIQYWVTPQFWLKGGLGFANLSVDDTYDGSSSNIDSGMAVMGALGFELLSSQRFSVDIQGRLLAGVYDGIDEQISAGTIGVGINWF
ncbi:MAG: hypothetical protein M3680_01595 [Myxococcota bacterium]|nr:hypothetical protein [Myxococcota bacterium]